MVERYEVKDISDIWNRRSRFKKWLDVEIAIAEVWYEFGEVPEESMKNIRENSDFDLERIDEIEKKVQHDVIAFLTSLEEFIGKDSAYIHKGITSYDIVDTALSIMLRDSLIIIIKKSEELKKILLKKAFEYREIVSIGRTHGIHAEPVIFGIKYLIWFEELNRNIERLQNALKTISVGKISGSVGTYIHFPREGEKKALKKLGLEPCKVSTQIIQRDRHYEVIFALASLASGLEKIAIDIRHLQRTDVLEVEEPFSKNQKGSSSMPHKKNPVKSERISGMARVLRGNLSVALENNLLWHERDISHSSAERIIFPDSFHLTSFMLNDMIYIVDKLNVYPENIKKNLEITGGIYFSQKLMTSLLDMGMARQEVYELVQKNALISWNNKKAFKEVILNDKKIMSFLTTDDINKIFSLKDMINGAKKIFKDFEENL